MSSRMFDPLLPSLLSSNMNFTLIAPDRRGFGHSHWSNPTTGPVTFDTFVNDLVSLIEHLAPGPFVFLAASMGCGESVLAHSASAYIRENCKGFIWIGPNMPHGERCEENPDGVDPKVWDFLVAGLESSGRIGFIKEQVPGIFRTDLEGNDIGREALGFYEGLVAMADPVAVVRTVGIMRRDMVKELEGLVAERVPVLMLHGDSDAGMPAGGSSMVVKRILPEAQLKIYERGGHGELAIDESLAGSGANEDLGIYHTHAKKVAEDVLEFLRRVLDELK